MPRIRSLRLKKRIVRDAPMVNVRPVRNRTSPRARRVESKRKITPRKRKVKPRNIRPVPIFVLSDTILFLFVFCLILICFGCWFWLLLALMEDLFQKVLEIAHRVQVICESFFPYQQSLHEVVMSRIFPISLSLSLQTRCTFLESLTSTSEAEGLPLPLQMKK